MKWLASLGATPGDGEKLKPGDDREPARGAGAERQTAYSIGDEWH